MHLVVKVVLALCAGITPLQAADRVMAPPGDRKALEAVARDRCHRQVAMLGESNTHGDGHTEAFKVALVERLVDECGYDSVFFEASHYEFLTIERWLRTGHAVSAAQIAAAVGGLWKFDREFQPLLSFLLEKAAAGKLSLGGIDDQLAGAGQEYANGTMIDEFTDLLSEPRRQACRETLHRRTYYRYSEAAPYSPADRAEVATCLSEVERAAAADRKGDRLLREERGEEISAAQRWIGRDFAPGEEQAAGRDRSMVQNFQWLRRQEPHRHKVILWAATVHIAKAGDPKAENRTGENFGTYLHRQYGARAFSLGFSALTGKFRQGRSSVRDLPAAPAESLEARAMQGSGEDTAYLGPARLAAVGTVPGAAFRHTYEVLPWATLLDGIVVFATEQPPGSLRE